jgi:hypothetical protein
VNLLTLSLLIAQVKSREPKPGDWSFGWGTVGIIAAVSAGIVFIIWLVKRIVQSRQRKSVTSPWHLFKDLCTAHGFTLSERQLLTRLARERNLVQPAMLFVEPATWELERASTSARTTELETLKRRVFAVR